MKTLYKNIRCFDPETKSIVRQDLLIENRQILPMNTDGVASEQTGDDIIAVPGLMDVHVHLRDPGQTHKETLETGIAAAETGGFSAILAMPNTVPAIDSPERMAEVQQRAAALHSTCRVFQSACLTRDRAGQIPTDAHALKLAGCIALTDDGSTPQDEAIMREVMISAAREDLPVIDHCECTALSKPGVLHDGAISRELGLPGQPRQAELAIVERDLRLAKETGCRIHLQHLSCAQSVQLLAQAQRDGIRATGEATPHHLLLTDNACKAYGTLAKMAPPLREETDRLALIDGIRTGVISVIATDNAPHTLEEKSRGWTAAPFGITGIEVALPLCLTYLVDSGDISLEQCLAAWTAGPANLLNLPMPSLRPGTGVTILRKCEEPWLYDVSQSPSKGRNTPWNGWKLQWRVL